MRTIGLLSAGVLGLGLAGAGAQRLHVYASPTPVLRLTCLYATSGTYPQVALSGVDLRRVNAAIRSAVLRAEFQPGHEACRKPPLPKGDRGIFRTVPDERLISASTTLVSALIPTLDIPPAGNDGAIWLDVTLTVPQGRVVHYRDLFLPTSASLRAVARIIRREATLQSVCIRNALADSNDPTTKYYAAAFAPGYSHAFALTPNGLVIGFSNGEATGPACGRIAVTVAYHLVRPYMTGLGKKLVAGALAPAS